jgi:hypothetical protein
MSKFKRRLVTSKDAFTPRTNYTNKTTISQKPTAFTTTSRNESIEIKCSIKEPLTHPTFKTSHQTKSQQPIHPINTTPTHLMDRSATTTTTTILKLPTVENASQTSKPLQKKSPA